MHTQPDWMPDGKELLFVSNRNVAFGSGDVMRMPVEPDGILKAKPVPERADVVSHASSTFRSTASDSFILRVGARADEYNHLYVLPTAGGENYKMTFGIL